MITLKPVEGYKYTQADENTPIEERIYATELVLGKFDKEENWKLITDEEAEAGKTAQILAMEEGMKIELPKE